MRLPASLALLLLASPAFASETPWQELAPGVKLRLITNDVVAADGTTLAGLELDMPQSMKTYWRVPGEAGIPTQVDFAGSSGISGNEMLWPYPRIETSGGYLDYVYRGPTVLPVRLKLDAPRADIAVSVLMGICSEVCVPASASFRLPLDFNRPDRAQGLRIAQAVALTPAKWEGGSSPIGPVKISADGAALAVSLADADIDPASVIADVADGSQLFGAPQKGPEPDLVLLPLLGGAGRGGLEGKPIELTFMTPTGAFALSTTISSSGSTAVAD